MPLLEVRDLKATYGDFLALRGVDLEVKEGEVVALIGANGAGKSTTLRAIMGLHRQAKGEIAFLGRPIQDLPVEQRVRMGLSLVPEGRRLFASLTVEENLRVARASQRRGPFHLARVLALFPALEEHLRRPASALSGGQQQMVAIGRALLQNPRILLCDEISLGLAPIFVREIYRSLLQACREEGLAVLVVEQSITQALQIADRFYVLREGEVALWGKRGEAGQEAVLRAYFGT